MKSGTNTLIFHEAAVNGYTDVLKDASSKDVNKSDEDGLTPTLLAAANGRVEALRMCLRKGGDPEKCDYTGNTALHWAALNGHLNCLSVIVNFGIENIFTLDNDYNTAFDLASANDRVDCVRFLDAVITTMATRNDPRTLLKLKTHAQHQAERRVGKINRIYQKREKKLQKREMQEKGDIFGLMRNINSNGSVHSSGYIRQKKKQANGSRRTRSTTVTSVTSHPSSRYSTLTATPTDIVILPSNSQKHVPMNQVFKNMDLDNRDSGYCEDTVERPRIGSLGVVNAINSTFSSFNAQSGVDESNHAFTDGFSLIGSDNDSVFFGTKSPSGDLPWSLDELNLDEQEVEESSPLEVFLAAHGLVEYLPTLTNEKIDLETLMDLSEQDLKGINIPLGSRKQLLKAASQRKAVLQSPGVMSDTAL